MIPLPSLDSLHSFSLFLSSVFVLSAISLYTLCVYIHPSLLGTPPPPMQYLLVTAHPDDECMFFAPTIRGLLTRYSGNNGGSNGAKVSLLCLSIGNHESLGPVRRKELVASCKELGIHENDVFVVDHPELQDNPKTLWSASLTSRMIEEYVQKLNIDCIITFDHGGVSGHLNHISIRNAISHYISTHPTPLPAYQLTTISIFRKYLFIFDFPITLLSHYYHHYFSSSPESTAASSTSSAQVPMSDRVLFLSTWRDVTVSQKAMQRHVSQYVWFRRLYIRFSRYMVLNELERIKS
ncbi:putative deacetylase LmbE-like domain-containing protein [Paraphysoderma sedebokerense]|nr:putative deacetylase LmbE-like domain-containing protein [Paraphysoderma sedebokerense]